MSRRALTPQEQFKHALERAYSEGWARGNQYGTNPTADHGSFEQYFDSVIVPDFTSSTEKKDSHMTWPDVAGIASVLGFLLLLVVVIGVLW